MKVTLDMPIQPETLVDRVASYLERSSRDHLPDSLKKYSDTYHADGECEGYTIYRQQWTISRRGEKSYEVPGELTAYMQMNPLNQTPAGCTEYEVVSFKENRDDEAELASIVLNASQIRSGFEEFDEALGNLINSRKQA